MWLKLLNDPCSAELARPCYTGTDAGYLIRTNAVFRPQLVGSYSNSGLATTGDYVRQYTPWNLSGSTGYLTAGVQNGVSMTTLTPSGETANFITQSVVRRYRPVAACMRWLPDGPYSNRSGTVGLNYSPGAVLGGSVTSTDATQLLQLSAKVVPNGMGEHEVKWLPTELDETWTTVGESSSGAGGSMFIVLAGVDGTTTSTTTATLNGRIEVITVWEWTPTTGSGGNATVSVKAPNPQTSQQVLSAIKDIGGFLYEGAVHATKKFGYAATGAVLTAGVRTVTRRAPGMLSY